MTGYMLALATVIPTAGRPTGSAPWLGSYWRSLRLTAVRSSTKHLAAHHIFVLSRVSGGGMLTCRCPGILAREAGPKRLGRMRWVFRCCSALAGGRSWVVGSSAYGWRWIFWSTCGRAVRARLGGDRVPKRSPGSVGKLRLHGPLCCCRRAWRPSCSGCHLAPPVERWP